MFIWRVDVIRIKAKAHENRFCIQHLIEHGYNRDTATTTLRQRFFTKGLFHCFFGGLVFHRIRGDHHRVPAMVSSYFDLHGLWCEPFKVFLEQFFNFSRILARYEPHEILANALLGSTVFAPSPM